MALDQDTFQQFLDTIGRFVRERMVPNEDRLEAEDHVPPEVLAEMKDIGLFALTIPEQYDGLGLGMDEKTAIDADNPARCSECVELRASQ
ncbi:MAG: hypothetical protein B7Z23_04210 [Pseudomonadales bacterium 32-61-5]|nr:MAG: hypothetical protein B7Z23_04210 [Pseudomonadales bacterium 32-61-5]